MDVWLVQREAFFLGGAWSEWLAGLSAPVVFDFDDAIWIRATSAANARFASLLFAYVPCSIPAATIGTPAAVAPALVRLPPSAARTIAKPRWLNPRERR